MSRRYRRTGLTPAGGLSERDLKWIRTFYPPLTEADHSELQVLESRRLRVSAGGQANFAFSPAVSRDYTIATHGESDTVMVLFEQPPTGDPIFLDGNDDSGLDINAKIVARLITGRKYIVRVRLFFEEREGESAIMIS